MGLAVLAAVLSLRVTEAAAVPVVERYQPTRVAPGANVAIHGRDFGTRKPQHTIRYGTGASALGQAEIRGWTNTRIDVRLPARIAPGRYWLTIWERETERTGRVWQLYVESPAPPPGSRPRSQQKALPGVQLDPPRARTDQPLRALSLGPFRVDRVGSRVDRYTHKGGDADCPEPDRDVFVPAAGGGQAYTGYVKYWDVRIGGLDCSDYTHQLYRGMVRFDVSSLRGKTIERAELIFRARVLLDENESSICARKPIAKMIVLPRPFVAGLHESGIGPARESSYPVSVLTGGQIKAEVTSIVRSWANGDKPNHGVAFAGRDETRLRYNHKCLVRMSDFKLDVDYHD
ncbi:MAG: hypothetical protein ACE5FC_10560 [Myxococcota bacterium]